MDEATMARCVAYSEDLLAPDTEARAWILSELEARGLPRIEVSRAEGRLLAVLAAVSGARRLLEVGTLGGYSALWLLSLLPAGARLVTIERSAEHADLAREAFRRAGESDRVRLVVGDAREVLPALTAEVRDGAEPYDLLFVDADKRGYPDYLEAGRSLLRPGALVLGDNAFLDGRVLEDDGAEAAGANAADDREAPDPDVAGIRAFNRALAEDPAFEACIVPVRDGLAVARFRGLASHP